jgi:hypothetical protein
MTRGSHLLLVFLLPVVLLTGVGAVLAFQDGRWDIVLAIFLGSSAFAVLLLGGVRLVLWWVLRGRAALFQQLARELEGTLVRNIMGEVQLRLPHPSGRIELDYRTIADDMGEAEAGGRWFTRLALTCDGGAWPVRQQRLRENSNELPAWLHPEARATIEALRAALGPDTRVRLDGAGDAPSAAVYVPGWWDDATRLRGLIEEARPRLETLLRTPWSNAEDPVQRGPS